jgi:hypothetical protein
VPYVFSYEKLDMPMSLKVMEYFAEHPETEQTFSQNLIWKLSRKPRFEELTKEEQEFLFKIDPYADGEVNNYKSVKYERWQGYPPEIWPEEIIPQPIPRSRIFAKFTKIKGFSEAEVEFYNPTSTTQKLALTGSTLAGDFVKAILQRLGLLTPKKGRGLFGEGGLGGIIDE